MPEQSLISSERIREQIRLFLLDGDFNSGDRLPSEESFRSRFGVSRTTIREALGPLVAAGLIVKKRGAGGGLFTGTRSSEILTQLNRDHYGQQGSSLRTVIDFLRLLEPVIVETACYRRTEAQLEAVRSHIESFRRAVAEGKPDLRQQSDFYHLLAQCCQNEAITQMDAWIQASFWDLAGDLEPDTAGILVELKYRDAVYECMEKGQGERARFLTQDHLIKYRVLVERRRTLSRSEQIEGGRSGPVLP